MVFGGVIKDSNDNGVRSWSGHVDSLDANEVEVLALLTGCHELFRLDSYKL